MYMIKEKILEEVKENDFVADIGSGDLTLARDIINLGAEVWAYDLIKGDTFIESSRLHFFYLDLNTGDYNFTKNTFNTVLLLNSLQFVKKEIVIKKLLPDLVGSLKEKGKIYIETFTRLPESSKMDFPSLNSFYAASDFSIPGTEIRLCNEGSIKLPRNGEEVTFHYIDLILEKR